MRVSVKPSSDPAQYPFSHPIRVRFAETDAMGIVHHSAYLPYLEEARVAYLRALDRPYVDLHDAGTDLTVIESWVGYQVPLRFDEVVDVSVAVATTTRATFQLAYCLIAEESIRATAVTVHGCVDRSGRPRRLPEWLAAEAGPMTGTDQR